MFLLFDIHLAIIMELLTFVMTYGFGSKGVDYLLLFFCFTNTESPTLK